MCFMDAGAVLCAGACMQGVGVIAMLRSEVNSMVEVGGSATCSES